MIINILEILGQITLKRYNKKIKTKFDYRKSFLLVYKNNKINNSSKQPSIGAIRWVKKQ